jgi:hypothetical protein
MRKTFDRRSPTQYGTRRDVSIIPDPAIVLDNRAGVEDAVVSYDRVGINHDGRHHQSAPAYHRRSRDGSCRMDEARGYQPVT